MAQQRKRTRGRIYWRERGGERRAYGDFRDFADVGGGREALKAKGAAAATTDMIVAEPLVAQRLADLQERRRRGSVGSGMRRDPRVLLAGSASNFSGEVGADPR
jgi:hypothetical protein